MDLGAVTSESESPLRRMIVLVRKLSKVSSVHSVFVLYFHHSKENAYFSLPKMYVNQKIFYKKENTTIKNS